MGAEVPIFFEILVLGIGFAEISRSLAGWTAPAGSNPADGPLANLPDDTPFRRLEDKYYPGDIGFDPAGLKLGPEGVRRDGDQGTPERPPRHDRGRRLLPPGARQRQGHHRELLGLDV